MDRLHEVLVNARDRLGCNGLRNLRDLAQMRQDTLERRFAKAQHTLTARNTLSIYTAWLWEKAFSVATKDLHVLMEKWCMYLWSIGCTRDMARLAWTNAQTIFAPDPLLNGYPISPLHMKMGSFITNQFPVAPNSKRKIGVLQERDISGESNIETTSRQEGPPATSKRLKVHDDGHGPLSSPFRYPIPAFPQPVSLARREFSSRSPSNRGRTSSTFENAASRAQNDYESSQRNDGFRFDFSRK